MTYGAVLPFFTLGTKCFDDVLKGLVVLTFRALVVGTCFWGGFCVRSALWLLVAVCVAFCGVVDWGISSPRWIVKSVSSSLGESVQTIHAYRALLRVLYNQILYVFILMTLEHYLRVIARRTLF